MRVNKKINIILILVCIFSCLKISTSYANIRESFNFKNITIEDGLSQSTVEIGRASCRERVSSPV